MKYSKRHDDITKYDVYTLHGLVDTIDLHARIFAEVKREDGRPIRRYYPQIDDDSRDHIVLVNPDGYRLIVNAKRALEEELAIYLRDGGSWALRDIAPKVLTELNI